MMNSKYAPSQVEARGEVRIVVLELPQVELEDRLLGDNLGPRAGNDDRFRRCRKPQVLLLFAGSQHAC